MGARRYGSSDGPIKLTEYHESRKELDGLPVTSAEKIPVTNTPNIFSYKAHVFAKNPALVQRYIKATKRSEEHTSELQSHSDLVCRLLLEKKKKKTRMTKNTT